MKKWFVKLNRSNIWLSAVMVILGLVLFLWPGKTLELLGRIVGIALLVGAVVAAINWYWGKRRNEADYVTLAMALLCLAAGIVVLVALKGVVSLLPKLIGVVIAVNGFYNLAQALELRGAGQPRWGASLAMAVLTILLGAFVFFHAFSVMKAAVMVIGGIFIYNGASNLWIESRCRKLFRR
ncbi:MAG: DUF308 domain-containing protein [Clostridia bacterium]|nr:DUF308 domain-containing protein [Clostridia bacterium]